MTERIKSSPVQHPHQVLPGLIVETAGRIFVAEIQTQGLENLTTVQELIRQNHPIVFMSNHQSFADPEVLVQALKRNGFKGLSEKLVFLAGETQANAGTKYLSRG